MERLFVMPKVQEKLAAKQVGTHSHITTVFEKMFDSTCQAIEAIDGKRFEQQSWTRNEQGVWVSGESSDGTVYIDRVLNNGNVFEKIGVNYVAIKGELPFGMTFQKSGALATPEVDRIAGDKGTPYFATGTSLVIHPRNPMVPIAHVNYRYFQIGHSTQPQHWWFGGGADLTPAYLFEEDAAHFHKVHKAVCDKYDSSYYPHFKKSCDEYFYVSHRGESRGVGGIFFDHLNQRPQEELLGFVKDCTEAFIPAYMPIVKQRKDLEFTEENKHWQHIVRGRYVEFILTSDRGARFGLASGMVNPQSVFNCMPPLASWKYDDQPILGTQEATLREVLKQPREWA